MVKIAIIGFGKMGRTIKNIAEERGHNVCCIFDIDNPFTETTKVDADVAIEFTTPEMAKPNILHAAKIGLPIVVGTTGWYEDFEDICDHINQTGGSLFYATNFSVGVNMFFKLNEALSRLMNKDHSYKASMEEIHHTEKKDAPSGTAITLAEGLIAHHSNIESWNLKGEGTESSNSLPIDAKRIENVPGTHCITFGNSIDEITISHVAHNRLGFATGAVLAAEWLPSHTGVHNMNDLLQLD